MVSAEMWPFLSLLCELLVGRGGVGRGEGRGLLGERPTEPWPGVLTLRCLPVRCSGHFGWSFPVSVFLLILVPGASRTGSELLDCWIAGNFSLLLCLQGLKHVGA